MIEMDEKTHILVQELAGTLEYPNKVDKKPLVSVLVMTYNQEDYIERCLNSILAQETNFGFEILVGEDHSNDNTLNICRGYADRYPNTIRLFEHTGNDKINLFGRPSGRLNFYVNMQAARGKYIALCEGDDYWNSTVKLQKQIDAFRADDTIALCFHRVWINHANRLSSDEFDHTRIRYQKIKDSDRLDHKILIEHGSFIHTPSAMFRKEDVWPTLVKLNEEPPAMDYVIYVIASSVGRIHQIDGLHATYSKGIGVWSSQPKWLEHLKWRFVLTTLESLECLDDDCRATLKKRIEDNDHRMIGQLNQWTWFQHFKDDAKWRLLRYPKFRRLVYFVLNRFR